MSPLFPMMKWILAGNRLLPELISGGFFSQFLFHFSKNIVDLYRNVRDRLSGFVVLCAYLGNNSVK